MTGFNPYSSNSSGGMSFSDALNMSKSMPNTSFSDYSSSFSVPSGFYDYKPGAGGMSFTEASKAKAAESDGEEEKGFLDKFLKDGNTLLNKLQGSQAAKESARETSKEVAKTWQSGSLGENLNFLAQSSGGNDQPMVIGGGGGQQQPGAGSRAVSGAMTGAQLGSFIPGVGTGVGAAIGAGAGLLGII